jgi:hypothetical protein
MRNLIFISLVLLAGSLLNGAIAQRNSNIGYYTIEPECLGVELDGSVTLRSWGTGRNRLDAVDQAMKNAVYLVVFKGVQKGNPSCNLKPLLPEVNAETKYEPFFNDFFDDRVGKYKKFCSWRDERVHKKKHRKGLANSEMMTCSIIIRVLRSKLKDYLEEE